MKRFPKALALLLVLAISGGLTGNLSGCSSRSCIQVSDETVSLDNGLVRMELDPGSAAIQSLQNLSGGEEYVTSPVPVLELEAGTNKNAVCFAPGGQNQSAAPECFEEEGRSFVRFSFPDACYEYNGEGTGIAVELTFSIGEGDEYVKLSCQVSSQSDGESIAALRLLPEGGFGAGEESVLTAPMWGGGTVWQDPASNKYFQKGINLGYPGLNDQSLEAGWMDYSASDGTSGIGIGYINTPKTAMSFQACVSEPGFLFTPTLFEMKQLLGKSVPLEPGSTFTTGELILAPHSGDWHRTADIYSAEFTGAMRLADGSPDFLEWEDISRKVRDTDYMIRFFAGLDGELVTTFADMYTETERLVRSWNTGDTPGEHCMVWIAGQNEQGYAFDVPAMIPAYGPSGGTDGLKELDEKLRELGCVTFHYEHPFAMDPEGWAYEPSADPGQHTEYWNLCEHTSVCIDNDAILSLWEDRLLPDIASVLADGIQFDQGSLQQTVCDREGHLHGTDALSRLTSHIRAMEELSQMARTALGEGGFLLSEGFSDMTGRYFDGAQSTWYRQQLFGGTHCLAVRQYLFPQYLNHYGAVLYLEDGVYLDSTLMGAVMGGIVTLNDGASEATAAEYVRFRQEIRAAEAPGFPQGYRDTVGLQVSSDDLFCQVFAAEDGITVTYCTLGIPVAGAQVTVDPAALGFPDWEPFSFSVDLQAQKADFQVFSQSQE